jgi:hypothetical protein
MSGLQAMQADRTGRPQVPQAAPRGDHKIDHWLRRSLSEAHDQILTEGLPASWIALIDKKLPPA